MTKKKKNVFIYLKYVLFHKTQENATAKTKPRKNKSNMTTTTEEETLYKTLTKLTKTLTNDCQTISQKGNNEEFTNATSSALECMGKLQDLLQFSEEEHRFLLLESCRVVNITVVDLIKASKVFAPHLQH